MVSSPSSAPDVLDLSLDAFESILVEEMGEVAYRARQVLHAIYHLGHRDFDSMTNLSRDLRARLTERFPFRLPCGTSSLIRMARRAMRERSYTTASAESYRKRP